MLTEVTTNLAPRPGGPYSQGLRAGPFVFVSGQGPIDPQTGEVVGKTIEEQTERTLENVRAILQAAGARMDQVVKVTAYLSRMEDFAAYNRVYERFFQPPRPCRTTVGAQLSRILVEIDAIAYVGT
ncbi:MAG TPA: Rid family detoxifying hydrolase [Limnochordia bacterium]